MVRFIESYVRNAENGGYLQTAVWESPSPHGAYTSFGALVTIFDFQACIWQRDGGNRIVCMGQVNGGDEARETVHMLHNRRVHFDRLLEMNGLK